MKPPEDRKTPKANPSDAQLRLAAMNLPESLAYILSTLRADIESLKNQGNLSMGELHKRMEDWRDDIVTKTASDIESAIQQHLAECHANGTP